MLPLLPLASPASRELLVLASTVKSVRELKSGSASIQGGTHVLHQDLQANHSLIDSWLSTKPHPRGVHVNKI